MGERVCTYYKLNLRLLRALSPAFLLLAWLFSLCGCSTKPLTDPIIGPDYFVRNVFQKEAQLPATVRRVTVLPMSFNEAEPVSVAGQQTLEPVFHAELAKSGRFETVVVTPSQLQQWTGRERWDSFEELPRNLFTIVAERTGSEAILFSRLTHYKPYAPIIIGWRMKLAANDADILWAAEELFDAAAEPVSNSARRYDRARVRNNPVLEDSRSILLSPTRFGQYTLASLLATLPKR